MDDDVDKIDNGPSALLEAGSAKGGEAIFLAQDLYFVSDRAYLLGAGASTDNKMAGDGTYLGQFQNDNIGAMAVMGQLSNLAGYGAAGFDRFSDGRVGGLVVGLGYIVDKVVLS